MENLTMKEETMNDTPTTVTTTERTEVDVERVEQLPIIREVSIQGYSKCETCGEFPPDFREGFERRARDMWINPSKSEHLTGDGKGGFKAYQPGPENTSEAGLYTAIIVPSEYRGKILEIREVLNE